MVRVCLVALIPVAVVGLGALPRAEVRAAAKPAGLKLGVLRGMFRDVPVAVVHAAATPFRDLLKRQTGVDGEVELVDDHRVLAAKLAGREVQFGVFHGFEWAWARAEHPDLQALAVTVPPGKRLTACLVVNQESKAQSPADLTEEPVVVPAGLKAHCPLYLERLRTTLPPGAARPAPADAGTEAVLDQVAQGKAAAALVDGAGLAAYQANKPGAGRALRVLDRSEPFPPTAVVYRRGAVDPGTVEKVRAGLVRASGTPQGKAFLFMWQLKGFEDVTPAYEADLARIAKAYPPPK